MSDETTNLRQLLARAETLAELERTDEARAVYRQVIEQAPEGSAVQFEAYFGLLATFDAEPQPCDAQVQTCIAAIEKFPRDAYLLLAMGHYMQQRGELGLAERSFEAAFRHGQQPPDHVMPSHGTEEPGDLAGVCLAVVQQLGDRAEEARRTLLEVAERYPDSARVRRHLLDAHIKAGDETAALGLVEGTDADPTIVDVVRGACRASRGESAAGLGLLQSAYVAGCRNPLCLRWLVAALLREGQLDAARPLLTEWKQLDPDSPELHAYQAAMEQFDADGQGDQQFRIDAAQPGSPQPELGQHAARSQDDRVRGS